MLSSSPSLSHTFPALKLDILCNSTNLAVTSNTNRMASFQQSYFPLEFVSTIAAYLRDDKESLASCTLVNSAWKRAARPLLFRSVTLSAALLPQHPDLERTRIRAPDFEAFTKEFASAPEILQAVHELQVVGVRSVGAQHEALQTGLPLDVLQRIVQQLQNLNTLQLTGVSVDITPTLCDVPVRAFQKLILTNAAFSQPDDVLRFFHVFGAYHLTIDCHSSVAPRSSSVANPVATACPPGLAVVHKLDMTGDEDNLANTVLRALVDAPQPPPLASLVLRPKTSAEVSTLCELLKKLARSLNHLELDLSHLFQPLPWSDTALDREHCALCCTLHELTSISHAAETLDMLNGSLDLSHLVNLESFELALKVAHLGEHFGETIDAACAVIRDASPSLRRLKLCLDFTVFEKYEMDATDFGGLEEAVLGLVGRGLERFTIRSTHLGREVRDERAELERVLKAKFSQVDDVLELKFSLDDDNSLQAVQHPGVTIRSGFYKPGEDADYDAYEAECEALVAAAFA